MFGKMSNFEIATRSHLIIRATGITTNGKKLNHLTESIDTYPTLTEYCGLEYPKDLDGESVVDILKNPETKSPESSRSFYYRNQALGKSIRTDRYRIVRWATEKDSTVSVELYDHLLDPNENINVASEQMDITDAQLKTLKTVQFMDGDMPFQTRWE
ncbi:sulfatase/phosphatase domain-containing protein [Planctomycetota bacterium]